MRSTFKTPLVVDVRPNTILVFLRDILFAKVDRDDERIRYTKTRLSWINRQLTTLEVTECTERVPEAWLAVADSVETGPAACNCCDHDAVALFHKVCGYYDVADIPMLGPMSGRESQTFIIESLIMLFQPLMLAQLLLRCLLRGSPRRAEGFEDEADRMELPEGAGRLEDGPD